MKRKPYRILRARGTHAKKKSECRKNIGTNIQISHLTRNEKPNTKNFVVGNATVTAA